MSKIGRTSQKSTKIHEVEGVVSEIWQFLGNVLTLFQFFYKIDNFWKTLLIFDTFSKNFAKLTVSEKKNLHFFTPLKNLQIWEIFVFWHIHGILADICNFHNFDIFWKISHIFIFFSQIN